MSDKIISPMRMPGIIQARGHAIAICGPETGHATRDIAFCDDALRARDIVAACKAVPELLEALRKADQFIRNGIEFGFIRMPNITDPANDTPRAIADAIAKAEGRS